MQESNKHFIKSQLPDLLTISRSQNFVKIKIFLTYLDILMQIYLDIYFNIIS